MKDINVPSMSNWTYLIEFYNQNVDNFSKLSAEVVMYCLQQPRGHGVLNQPFGQALAKNCSLYGFDQDAFVIKNDGHVSDYVIAYFIAKSSLLINQQYLPIPHSIKIESDFYFVFLFRCADNDQRRSLFGCS